MFGVFGVFEWIDPTFHGVDIALTALVVLLLVLGVVRTSPAGMARVRDRVAATPDGLVRHYRLGILSSWVLAGIALEPTLLGPGVTLTDLGLGRIDGFSVGLAVGTLVLGSAGRVVRVRLAASRRREGRVVAGAAIRRRVAFLIPRTRSEQWWAAALAVTAGVTEEIVFRGLLIAAGVGIFGLPAWAAALLAAACFGLSHRYQGRAGMVGTTVIGLLITVLYAVTGNLLVSIALHVAVNVVTLLATPRELFEPADPAPPAVADPSAAAVADPSAAAVADPSAAAVAGPESPRFPRLRAAAPD